MGAMMIIAPILLLACQPLKSLPLTAVEPETPKKKAVSHQANTDSRADSPSAQPATVQSYAAMPTLPAAHWQLISAFDAERNPISILNSIKESVQLTIPTEGSVGLGYGVGCNARGGNFRLQALAAHSRILTVTDEMGDAQMCPDLLAAEQLLGGFIDGHSQLQLLTANNGSTDTLMMLQITDEGSVLLWQAQGEGNAPDSNSNSNRNAVTAATVTIKPASVHWLAQYDWTLDFAIDNRHLPIPAFKAVPKIAQVKAQLEFNQANTADESEVGLGYQMGCNWHSAGYKLIEGKMTKLSKLTISTLIGCNDEIEQAEAQLGSELASPSRLYALEGLDSPILVQTNERGSLLLWQGQTKSEVAPPHQ